MTRLVRVGAALFASVALLALLGGTALAGGWAEAAIINGGGDPPVAGEEREIELSLLQHSVTPVDWGQVQLTAIHPETGEEIVVAATSQGGGRWLALVTFPEAGDWQIQVTHSDLETSGPMAFAVGPSQAMTWLPPTIALVAFAAIAMAAVGAALALRRRSEPAAGAAGEVVRAGG